MENTGVALKGPFASLELKNPVLTASGTFGYGREFAPFGDLRTLGGIVVKGLSLKPREGNPMPRTAESACGLLNAVGLQNCGAEAFLRDILPALPTDEVPVIANIYGATREEFAELAGMLSGENGIAGIEVNISCPNVRKGGQLFGQDPRLAAAVTAAVRARAGRRPLIVKLTPNVTDIAAVARACEDAGADIISCINTLSGTAVDLATRRPRLGVTFGGLSGPAVKPVALRCVLQVARAVSVPVIGIGGIRSAEDVLEFIMVGAHAVQIGTASFSRPDTVFRIVEELPAVAEKYGVSDWESFRGSLLEGNFDDECR